ncbi:MAG: hypothetical protein LBQ91_03145 [Oscillospiraceae bacterium]|nr:hypothetical protein [Oscillospiraceae bacterium]
MAKCPGADRLRDAVISEKTCPECGRQIEMFSIFPTAVCECGFVAQNDAQSCVLWCAHARECVGNEMYEKLTKGMRK